MSKLKKQLKEFETFKANYNFKMRNLTEIDGEVFYEKILIKDKEGNITPIGENFVNVGYKLKNPLSKVLSNLFPYSFVFQGKTVASLESVFQGIKFQNKKAQNLVLSLSGTDAVHIKVAAEKDWKEYGILFWQGKPMDRHSPEYTQFINELYISAIQNPLYKQALINAGNFYIMHSMGELEEGKTVFTRYEFECMLNCLKDFLKK